MRGWYSVLIDGELRINADQDPRDFVECALRQLEEQVEDVEFDVQDAVAVTDADADGSAWLFHLSMRFAERFAHSSYAEAAARAAAEQMEAIPLDLVAGVHRAKIVFQLHSADSEDWDDADDR